MYCFHRFACYCDPFYKLVHNLQIYHEINPDEIKKHIFFKIILYYKDYNIGQCLNLTILCFLYVWFLQTVPKMWKFKLILVLRWIKMCIWHWAVLLSPTHQWDLWPGGRRLMGERKSSNRLRPSGFIQSVPLTVDCTAVKPPMTLEVESHRELRLKSDVSRMMHLWWWMDKQGGYILHYCV